MSGESPSFRNCSKRISRGIDEITSRKRAIYRYFTRQISNIKERNSSLVKPILLPRIASKWCSASVLCMASSADEKVCAM
jgi:hypothetical protein